MEELDTIKYKGCTIRSYYDDQCESPRIWRDKSTIYTTAGCVIYPREGTMDELEEKYENDRYADYVEFREEGEDYDDFEYMSPTEWLNKNYVWRGMCVFEHGVTIIREAVDLCNVNFGIIAVDRAEVESGDEDEVSEYLRTEIKEFADWVYGDCYAITITDDETDEEIFSCGGYIGDESLAEGIKDCREMIDRHAAKKEVFDRLYFAFAID